MKLYDVSLPISNTLPVWPGDPPVSLVKTASIGKGDQCNITNVRMGAHTGTHIDAPHHFLQDGLTTDAIPLETFVGPCFVLESDAEVLVDKKDLQKVNLAGYSRILIKTKNSQSWIHNTAFFNTNYVALGLDAAQYLAEMRIALVGIDFLSIESYQSVGSPIHKLLFENNIAILEGLNLSGVSAGAYELLCLPLKLVGCEGAPARVFLRELS